ncbi:lysophospholipid acyltransferase family protein [uncultured Bilophila sp.]|uniref:lysophospholipid acyltransferase family protein n=1 Tax=uncultured Bilophila sp. TaxID=529385 RepID=UPI00280A5EB4|nr:lysophospholipid acyltransferase family protein [uncultured Bilophila sp.]
MTTSSHLFDANWYLTSSRSPSLLSRISPNLAFYAPMVWIVAKAGCDAMRNRYDGEGWTRSSEGIARALESVGCRIEATGLEYFRSLEGPCVFIGNHMSTLETFVLPSMIQPWKDVTFVVKESLLKYPFFGPVLASREPIGVGGDLVAVLEGGEARLKQGRSVIVFPQSTRSTVFEPAHFNTIGVKLAKRAGVPVIPLALKTDAWGNGNLLKDFGPINAKKAIHFEFGAPMRIEGTGKAEHLRITEFITERLGAWGREIGE